MKDYFEVLEVTEEAGRKAIADAYRRMKSKYPAGLYPEKSKDIEEAYRMLSDPALRRACIEFHRMTEDSKQAYETANELLDEGDFVQTAKILEKALKNEKFDTHLKFLLGIAYLNMDKPFKAAKMLEPVRDMFPQDAELNNMVIKARIDAGHYKKAIELAEECYSTDKDNYVLVSLLADGYKCSGRYGKAAEILLESFNNPAFSDKLHSICTDVSYILFLDKKYDSCLEWIEKLVDLPADEHEYNNSVNMAIGILYYFVGSCMLPEAHRCAEIISKLVPDWQDAAEISRKIESMIMIEPEIKGFRDDEFIPKILKVYATSDVCNIEAGELLQEQEKAYSVLLEYQILGRYSDFLMALRYMKTKYPRIYEIKADFYDALQDARERKKLISSNKAMFFEYRYEISELMDKFEAEFDEAGRETGPDSSND